MNEQAIRFRIGIFVLGTLLLLGVLIVLIASSILMALSMQAKIITVNTADNTDFSAGKTNLVTAINALADGDTIQRTQPQVRACVLRKCRGT